MPAIFETSQCRTPDPDPRDANGTTPLYFAAQEGHLDCVKWLTLHARADILCKADDGMCSAHAAAQAGKVNVLRFLLMKCTTRVSKLRDGDGATPVHFAAAKGHVLCLRFLLADAGASGNEKDNIDATPVHDAAEQGQLHSLKLLAHYGADLTAVDKDGLTPRKLALDRNNVDCARFLAMTIAHIESQHAAQPDQSPRRAVQSPMSDGSRERAEHEEAELFGELDVLQAGVGWGSSASTVNDNGQELAARVAPTTPPMSKKKRRKADKKRAKEQRALVKQAKKDAKREAKLEKRRKRVAKKQKNHDDVHASPRPQVSVFKAKSERHKAEASVRPGVEVVLWERANSKGQISE